MSFLPINEENQQAPQGQTTNAPVGQPPPQTSGSAGSAGAAPKGSAAGSPTQFGSSASKLGDYLSANAPQITSQANTLAGNLNTQYGNVSQGITNAANQFGQQVQGGYAANNPDVVNQAMADPTKFASDPNNVAAFQGQYNNAYTGPTSFESTSPYSDIQNQVGQAVQQGNLLSTQAGLQSYLQGQGNNPTKASSMLDTLLMQGNPEAQQTINTAAGQFGNLTGQLGTATTGANQSVADAQKAAQDASIYAQQQFGAKTQGFGSDLQNRLDALQNQYTTANSKIAALRAPLDQNLTAVPESFWGQNNLDPRLIQALGAMQGFNATDPNEAFQTPMASTYLQGGNPGGGAPSFGSVATDNDVSTANALAQLSGGSYKAPVTATEKYQLPVAPSYDANRMANDLYGMVQKQPTLAFATNDNAAMNNYRSALSNLEAYLGLPATTQTPPAAPPPADGGGDTWYGGV